ncbi:MAG: hypothetical protein JJT78_14700 [Leptospira sp.]|nr:hypothetical protein [Leptospira sp.]
MKRFFLVLFLTLIYQCAGGITEEGGHIRNIHMIPNATIIRSSQYEVLDRAQGESSTLFLLGFLPVTKPLNIEYAMSQAVQKVPGGQSMVDVVYWHETHYYFPLGLVSVVKVEGKVISLQGGQKPSEKK